MSYWDWDKLPEKYYPLMRSYFENSEYGKIMVLHNKFKMSREYYCCEDDAVKRYVKEAIENGII